MSNRKPLELINVNPFAHLRYSYSEVLREDQRYIGDAGLGPERVVVVYAPEGTSDQIVLYLCLHASTMWCVGWMASVADFRFTQHASIQGGLFRDAESAKLYAMGEITARYVQESREQRVLYAAELYLILLRLTNEARQKTLFTK